jgi:hypothetical protein
MEGPICYRLGEDEGYSSIAACGKWIGSRFGNDLNENFDFFP